MTKKTKTIMITKATCTINTIMILFSLEPPLQDLLRQCIRVEVGERLSLEAILCHPWLLPNNNSSTNCNDPNKISTSSNSGVLGGLPIPNRDHAAKGMNHPQVNFFLQFLLPQTKHKS